MKIVRITISNLQIASDPQAVLSVAYLDVISLPSAPDLESETQKEGGSSFGDVVRRNKRFSHLEDSSSEVGLSNLEEDYGSTSGLKLNEIEGLGIDSTAEVLSPQKSLLVVSDPQSVLPIDLKLSVDTPAVVAPVKLLAKESDGKMLEQKLYLEYLDDDLEELDDDVQMDIDDIQMDISGAGLDVKKLVIPKEILVKRPLRNKIKDLLTTNRASLSRPSQVFLKSWNELF